MKPKLEGHEGVCFLKWSEVLNPELSPWCLLLR